MSKVFDLFYMARELGRVDIFSLEDGTYPANIIFESIKHTKLEAHSGFGNKSVEILETRYKAYVVNVNAASKAGTMVLLACINGCFYGFEIKWKNDQPS